MNSNKKDVSDEKVSKKHLKSDTNGQKCDSFDNRSNDRTVNACKTRKPFDNFNRSGSDRTNYQTNGHNSHRRQFHNASYFYNSNRNRYNPSTEPNQRSEVRPSRNRPTNYDRNTVNDNHLSEERPQQQKTQQFHDRVRTDKSDSYSGHNSKRYFTKRENSPEVHENLQQKLDELTVLKSIFDDNILTVDESELKGRFMAEPVLNENRLIICYNIRDNNRNNGQSHRPNHCRSHTNSVDKCPTQEFCVQHLPPIELYFELSRKYPQKLNPMFLISCKWLTLSQLEKICDKLEDLYYENRSEVLFAWFTFLQNDCLKYLAIEDKLDITSVVNQNPRKDSHEYGSHRTKYDRNRADTFQPRLFRGDGPYDLRAAFDMMGSELIPHLKSYDEYKQKETFKKTFFSCNICFSSHSGDDCVVFPCDHINCRDCITNYFITLIKEGTVHQLKCPESQCQTTAPNSLVRELITGELYDRYDKLLLDSLIGTMSDAHYCPRKMCGNLVMAETESSLAHCNSCGHAFCKNCKQTYHGFDPCSMFRNPEQRKQILEEYEDANATEKAKLEKIYGKKQLVSALEEMATDKWLEDMSKRCPHCKAFIEKSDGCNKMACWRCNTFFCWLCLEQLPLIQPYTHFNNPDSKCFNQLFRGVQFDPEDMFEDDFE